MSQYAINNILQIVKALLDRVNVGQQNPTLYNTFLSNAQNPMSDLHRMMMAHVNQATQGQWVNGVHQDAMVNILRPFLTNALNQFDQQMRAQMQPAYGNGFQQGYQQQPMIGNGYPPPYAANSTASLYDNGPTPQPQPVVQQPQQNYTLTPTGPEKDLSMDEFNRSSPVSIHLNDADTLQHHPKPGNVVSLDNYKEGEFENIRISTIDIVLNTAENSAAEAATKAIRYAPNEVVRGLYANVVCYKEIFYIPMKTSEFKRIALAIGAEFYKSERGRKPDWRAAVTKMGELTRAEHKTFETALLKLLNPSIFKFLRTSNGDAIEGIEEIDDLKELDNPRSKLKVTQHAHYLGVFDELTTRAFDNLLKPSHLIEADDKNFGDFVHCDQIEFWYDDRSKYDYGTYAEKADRLKFIDSMTERNTVLRILKNTIVTNALDERMASNITYYRAKDILPLATTQNVGCKLLLSLEQPKRGEIERVVCIGSTPGSNQVINLGRTLDGALGLIK